MKRLAKLLTVVVTVAICVVINGSARGQWITNVLSDFKNFNLSVTYANWNDTGGEDSGYLPINGGTGYQPSLISGPDNFTVIAQGWGSGAYDFPTPVSVPGATMFLFTFTINTDTSPKWMNPLLTISDGTKQVWLRRSGGPWLNYGSYGGPATYTLVGDLTDQFTGALLDTTTITAFNIGLDPAEYGAFAPYSITFHQVALLVPEPSIAGLVVLGAGLLWLGHRRRSIN